MDEAIEIAALNLNKKLKKNHTKWYKRLTSSTKKQENEPKEPKEPKERKESKESNCCTVNVNSCPSCKMKQAELESGRRSPIIMSPTTSAKNLRRRGVSERNRTEAQLVREAMKFAMLNEMTLDILGLP